MKKLILIFLLLLSLLSFSQQYEIANILSHDYIENVSDSNTCNGQVEYKGWVGYVYVDIDPICSPYLSKIASKSFVIRKLVMVRDTLGSRIFFYVASTREDTLLYILSICYTDGQIESIGIRLEHFVIILGLRSPIKQTDGG